MSACKYDRESGEYLTSEGEPCETDDYGDPTHHCTAKRNCSWHVGYGELTCARCVGEVRWNILRISTLSALLMPAAIAGGVESEAASLAGPACDPEAWAWRKVAARQGRAWHVSLIEDDDERHPLRVLGIWCRMISEDYGHDMPPNASLSWCAEYLTKHLHRIAQDDEQDFPLMRRELRACRKHVEAVLRNDDRADRGAPCPECTTVEKGVGPRLVRRYGHWCEDERCEKIHYHDDSADEWVCPANREHKWSMESYEKWVTERRKKGA